jgi:hypothetical protein
MKGYAGKFLRVDLSSESKKGGYDGSEIKR